MTRSKAQILLAEDNPHDLRLALEAFTRNELSHLVHTVRDGAEALEYLAGTGDSGDSSLKLALVDLKLPKISGLEVLRRMRLEQRMRRIPVVMLSSPSDDRDLLAHSYEAGANSCVMKPAGSTEFTELLRVLCRYWLVLNRTPEVLR